MPFRFFFTATRGMWAYLWALFGSFCLHPVLSVIWGVHGKAMEGARQGMVIDLMVYSTVVDLCFLRACRWHSDGL